MRLIAKVIPTKRHNSKNDTDYVEYQLLTAKNEWYRIACKKEIRNELTKYEHDVVAVEVDRPRFNQRIERADKEPLLIPTLSITSIESATEEEQKQYNEVADKIIQESFED